MTTITLQNGIQYAVDEFTRIARGGRPNTVVLVAVVEAADEWKVWNVVDAVALEFGIGGRSRRKRTFAQATSSDVNGLWIFAGAITLRSAREAEDARRFARATADQQHAAVRVTL